MIDNLLIDFCEVSEDIMFYLVHVNVKEWSNDRQDQDYHCSYEHEYLVNYYGMLKLLIQKSCSCALWISESIFEFSLTIWNYKERCLVKTTRIRTLRQIGIDCSSKVIYAECFIYFDEPLVYQEQGRSRVDSDWIVGQ